MARSEALQSIMRLDPQADHQQIVLLSTRYDFPFDTTRALEFALFRTFAVLGIAHLLEQSGEFLARPQRRYDDTDIIVSELMERGYDSERGRAALRRMNQLHGRFDIPNDQLLYVLSTFAFEPMRWNQRFGWRMLSEIEKQAYFNFWREVGRRMGIHDLPEDMETFDKFNREYERRHFQFSDATARVGQATLAMMCGWFPPVLRPMVRAGMFCVMDDPMRSAFGFPRPAAPIRWAVHAAMRLRAGALRFLPRRKQPLLRTDMRHRSHPDGYRIEDLGPPINA
jgi:hypothetical protein